MEIDEKGAQGFKRIFQKYHDKELTEEEARYGAENLLGFFKLLIKVDDRLKLKNSSRGSSAELDSK